MVYYSPQHEGIILNEEGKLQYLTKSTSICRNIGTNNGCKQSLGLISSTICSVSSVTSSRTRIPTSSSFHGGLRRSTFDLSDYDADTGSCQKDFTFLRKRLSVFAVKSDGAAKQVLLDAACAEKTPKSDKFSSTSSLSCHETMGMRSSVDTTCSAVAQQLHHQERQCANKKYDNYAINGLESIIEDVFWGYLSLLLLVVNMDRQVRSLLREIQLFIGDAWEELRTLSFHFEEPLVGRNAKGHGNESILHYATPTLRSSFLAMESMVHQSIATMQKEDQKVEDEDFLTNPEVSFTPLKLITTVTNSDTKSTTGSDEWGHFADFQEELADESRFIPSCCRVPSPHSLLQKGSSSGLTPLTEVMEAEPDEEEDLTF
jgi:hypothetical protein